MFTVLRWLVLTVFLTVVLAVGAALALAFFALESQPRASQSAPPDHATVLAGKELVKRLKSQIESADARGTTLTISEAELNHIAQLGAHTFAWLYSDVDIDRSAVTGWMSARLPPNPFGSYLNLGVSIAPSADGLVVEQISVGPLRVPGRWSLPLVAAITDALLRDRQASQLLASVREVRIAGNAALLTVTPPADVKDNVRQAVRTLQAYRFPPGEQERVIYYYDLLAATAAASGGGQSLGVYLAPLMREAAARREGSSAVVENRSAIWALAIYFSNGGFETLVGKLVSEQRSLQRSPSNVTLGGRADLKDHFVYSAGITLATEQGIGIAAGEFKELLDSGDGGSGFSFADLAADRAGVAFVRAATASEESARRVQQLLAASAGEENFFPSVAGLVEGLSDEQFRQQYGDVRAPRYLQQVELIDGRIAQLPIHR